MTLSEKTAYLKGLCDGMSLDESKDETKVIKKMLEVLDEAALTIGDLEERIDELEMYADELDEDLGELEGFVYEAPHHHPPHPHHHDCCDDYDDYCDCDECDCDDEDFFDEDDFEDDDEIIEVACPSCDEIVCLPPTIDLGHVICPACGEEFSCICDCDECDCEDCSEDCE